MYKKLAILRWVGKNTFWCHILVKVGGFFIQFSGTQIELDNGFSRIIVFQWHTVIQFMEPQILNLLAKAITQFGASLQLHAWKRKQP